MTFAVPDHERFRRRVGTRICISERYRVVERER